MTTLITLAELTTLLSNPVHVYSINGCAATLYLNPIKYDDDNIFLLIVWTEYDYECNASFAEGVNRQIKREGDTLSIIDQDDVIVCLTIGEKGA